MSVSTASPSLIPGHLAAEWLGRTWAVALGNRPCSVTRWCPSLCNSMDCSLPGSSVFHDLPEFAQIHVHWVSDASNQLTLCLRVFPMSWLFQSGAQYIGASASPSNEYSGLASSWVDWFDLLTVQGSLKSLLQHLNSTVSILQHSAFFMIQLSRPHMTTDKTIAVNMWNSVGNVMCLLFNILPRFVRAFLPRSKRLLISCL